MPLYSLVVSLGVLQGLSVGYPLLGLSIALCSRGCLGCLSVYIPAGFVSSRLSGSLAL